MEAAADRGMAMAHVDGKVVFIPFAAPGDLAEVEIERERPRYAEGRILRILELSPLRRPPPCPHFGSCGGCQWQHLPYADQLSAKDRCFRSLLASRLGMSPKQFRPAIPSPAEWGYRNRVGLKVRADAQAVVVGYFAPKSHRPVQVRACPVAHRQIENVLDPLRVFLGGFAPARGRLPQVDLQVDGQERLWAVFHLLRPLGTGDRRSLAAFVSGAGLAGALTQIGRKQSLSVVFLRDAEDGSLPFASAAAGRSLSLRVTPGGFVQANPGVNQALIAEVESLSELYSGRTVLDLYCGAGNFTLPLALRASEVVGIEGFPPAARDAERNARRNGLDNVRVISRGATEGLRVAAAERLRPAFALLDPPREGAKESLSLLASLGPRWCLYISCAPPTLVRDLAILGRLGYRVQWTRMADMFPQTAHTECITLLRRAGGRLP